jgi:hypothetical protein
MAGTSQDEPGHDARGSCDPPARSRLLSPLRPHPDAAPQQVERYQVRGAQYADAVEWDQRHRQREDAGHAWIAQQRERHARAEGYHQIGEAVEMEGEMAAATLGQQGHDQREYARADVAPARVADERLGQPIVRAVPENSNAAGVRQTWNAVSRRGPIASTQLRKLGNER